MLKIKNFGIISVILIFLMLLFAQTVFAEQTNLENLSSEDTIRLMNEIEPFISLQKDYTVKFNESDAAQKRLSTLAVEFGKEYEKFHNATISSIRGNDLFGSKPDSRQKIFTPFFEKIKNTGMMSRRELYSAAIETKESKQITQTKQSVIFFNFPSKIETISFQTACGGGYQSPHYCPVWNYSSPSYSSYNAVRNALLGQGYHNTYWPGCRSGTYNCTYDFTRWVNAYSCPNGPFRSQRITYQTGGLWKYRTQSPEPNPEIFSYSWPAYWWGPYVQWWHGTC